MIRAFVDSDVVISALLSDRGAASLLLRQSNVAPVLSSISVSELKVVSKRLGIRKEMLVYLLKQRFAIVKLKKSLSEIKISYARYVLDINDAHIVAGAIEAKARFLISYNLKHFRIELIMRDLNLLIMTPGTFLQYLRSLPSQLVKQLAGSVEVPDILKGKNADRVIRKAKEAYFSGKR